MTPGVRVVWMGIVVTSAGAWPPTRAGGRMPYRPGSTWSDNAVGPAWLAGDRQVAFGRGGLGRGRLAGRARGRVRRPGRRGLLACGVRGRAGRGCWGAGRRADVDG